MSNRRFRRGGPAICERLWITTNCEDRYAGSIDPRGCGVLDSLALPLDS
jgi:hypothetical protein